MLGKLPLIYTAIPNLSTYYLYTLCFTGEQKKKYIFSLRLVLGEDKVKDEVFKLF